MIAYSKRFKKSRPRFFALFFGIILLLMLGFLGLSNFKLNKKRAEFNSRLQILAPKIQELKKRNQELEEKISEIPTEDYLEQVAREKMNLKKPGEEVVVIKKEQESPTSTPAEKNNFGPQNWLDWLKSKL
ncbi:septum formation initiator family protein, partial [Patescibacteria group bacterium]|nr:septum formation initiator family protein [Patescibacteria group bacterium]